MKAPSVIIGVGGIGAEICANVAMMPGNTSRENIRFVIIDTDINSIRELHRKGFRGTEILLTDNMTVQRCRESMDSTEFWYPESDIFNEKPMTEGAGQQRAISRLALDYSIREGKLNPLFDVIQELNELTMDDSNQQMRFYIISSLAGGTGSGLILPLALYLKRFVFEESGDNLSICKGFFVLSSALRRSVGTRLEQKSLDSNAYAAVKELHAFMQSADNQSGRYSDIALPLTSSDNSYQTASYEYCFLFGIANERGRRMHSFEELKLLVAQAVNMQACSPIHDRNSSREDNTIKHITYQMLERGGESLSRFGGIGCGELVYPYEILKEYYALQWALDVMGGAWQAYDEGYYVKQNEQMENRRLGRRTTPVFRGTEYINGVQFADRNDHLAEEIRNSCMDSQNTESWKGYLNALEKEVSRQVEERKAERRKEGEQHDDEFVQTMEEIKRLPAYSRKEKIVRRNKMIRSFKQLKSEVLSITAQLQGFHGRYFFEMHSTEGSMESYWIEYWLEKDGEFIHPNGVRYFLYQLIKALEEKIPLMEMKLEAERNTINNRDNDEEKTKWLEHFSVDIESESKDYGDLYEALYQYVKDQLYTNVLKSCKGHAERLARNYEEFYDSIQEMLDVFLERRDELVMELDRTTGISKFYVCADGQCREKMFMELQQQPEFIRTAADFSYKIYEMAQVPVEGRIQRKQRFQQMEQYWKDDLEKNFKDILDMNILRAMDKEEVCKNGRHMSADEMTRRIDLVRNTVIEPFVQYYKMAGEEQGISICCYNSILGEDHGEYQEVARWLRRHEGVDDDVYCDAHRIMFYRSFVGLDAGKVLEYLHWNRKSRFKGSGRAFRYYEQTLLDMGKAKNGQSQITPHIDKKWHNLLIMPDTDESYQTETEIEIAVAFLYGVVCDWICRESLENKKGVQENDMKSAEKKYRIRVDDYVSEEIDNLHKTHVKLYDNSHIRKQLHNKLNKQIHNDNMMGSSQLLEKIRNHPGGIYKILVDYNEELPLGLQDSTINRYLVIAVDRLVERCMHRDTKDIQKEKEEFLKEAWEQEKSNGAFSSRDSERREMIVRLIESYFQNMNE